MAKKKSEPPEPKYIYPLHDGRECPHCGGTLIPGHDAQTCVPCHKYFMTPAGKDYYDAAYIRRYQRKS